MISSFEIQRIERAERALAEQVRESERQSLQIKNQYLSSSNRQQVEQKSFRSIQEKLKEDSTLPLEAKQRFALVRLRGRFLMETRARVAKLQRELKELRSENESVGRHLFQLKRRGEVLEKRKGQIEKRAIARKEESQSEELVSVKFLHKQRSAQGVPLARLEGQAKGKDVSLFQMESLAKRTDLKEGNSDRRIAYEDQTQSPRVMIANERLIESAVLESALPPDGRGVGSGALSQRLETLGVGERKENRSTVELAVPEVSEFPEVSEAPDVSEATEVPAAPEGPGSEYRTEFLEGEQSLAEAGSKSTEVSEKDREVWRTQYESLAQSSEDDAGSSTSPSSQVEKLELYRNTGSEGMSLSYRLSEEQLVKILIKRRPDGKLSVHLNPEGIFSRSDLRQVRAEIARQLREQGLSITRVTLEGRVLGSSIQRWRI